MRYYQHNGLLYFFAALFGACISFAAAKARAAKTRRAALHNAHTAPQA